MRIKRLLIFAVFILFQVALQAQEGRGTIAGRVIDPTGAVVAGAEVRVTNVATGSAAIGRTNETGNYTIPFLLPGTCTLTVEMAGFKKAERPGIEVRVNDVLSTEVSLQVGNTAEKLEVAATAPLLESSTVSLGQVIDREFLDRCRKPKWVHGLAPVGRRGV